jgi:non-specific serine/threonine protein kinase/serine/threonine-protein kinase
MPPERELDDLVRTAVGLDEEERASLLAAVAAEDSELGRQLFQEVTVALGPSGSGSAGSGGAGRPARGVPAVDLAGQRLGAYRVLRSLGRGGMGEVFLAERADGEFEGRVALKVVRPGGGEDVLHRFRAERQTLANLEHPNIARLLDAGSTDEGRPYLVMEHVDGVRIDRYCDERGLGIDERLAIFLDVCEAVQHAHRNLVVHRDLKPDNILVSAEGEVKLLDFGIAKLLPGAASEEMAVETVTGQAAMSLHYASPEQLVGEPVTTATDVHALGILLYQLLTGRHPFVEPAEPAASAWRAVLDRKAEPPSQRATAPFAGLSAERLRRRLAGDLDNITLKALRKEAERRYPSVEQLAEDVRRHLDGRPVRARPDTLDYRTAKFLRRHRLGVLAAALIVASLVAGMTATLWQARIAEQRAADVRALAGSLIFEVDDLIRDLPGSTPARQQIVTRALTYLDRLAGESSDDPELSRELALAYLRVGNIQGNPNTSSLGDTRGALASYHRALDLAGEAVRAAPGDENAARSLAVIHEKLADTGAWTGDLGTAEREATSALGIFEDLARRHPETLRHQFSLAISLVKMGDLQGNPDFPNLGRPEEALGTYHRALRLLDQLGEQHPEDSGVLRYRALVRERLGTVLLAAGNLDGATEVFRESLAIREAAAVAQPANAEARRDVAVALEKLADALLEAGDTDQALASTRESFEVFRALAAADPRNATARRSLAISHRKVAAALERAGQTVDARFELLASRAIFEELAAADPSNAQHQKALADIEERLASLPGAGRSR